MKELTKKQKAEVSTEKEIESRRIEALKQIQVCHICGQEYNKCNCGWD